ncbi:uncharacterized protein LOC133187065 [Saccostrea echinata]|uniref:uncharacterized protein LOC133187065 n=1 Tax=Saccostrea echinata TaxID=191078 RepID=UPI002A825364|nr:uncharacterized protein LOC133187065 [Saccostrea echinata]
MITPGFLIDQDRKSSIFYFSQKKSESDSWSTKSYLAYDEENDTHGTEQLSMIDVQLECILAVVLGGFGWLILLSNSMKKAPFPPMFLTGGIFLLVAVTSEFAVLVRFLATNAAHAAFLSRLETIIMPSLLDKSSYFIGVPYSLILAGFGIILILFAVVRIFIRHKRYQLPTEMYKHMSYEPWSNMREFRIVSQQLTGDVESNLIENRV